eukprot:4775906-Pyramimonas_sp.AAC.1
MRGSRLSAVLALPTRQCVRWAATAAVLRYGRNSHGSSETPMVTRIGVLGRSAAFCASLAMASRSWDRQGWRSETFGFS